ncbi:hypothetical protein JHK86_049803 [Glycine max]|nr:hypothetical protein JHK86_049803 [Glycine max]
MMNGLPMSESIKDILVQDPHVLDAMKYLYITDFDIKPNVILYDTHVVPNKHKQKIQQAMAKKLEPNMVRCRISESERLSSTKVGTNSFLLLDSFAHNFFCLLTSLLLSVAMPVPRTGTGTGFSGMLQLGSKVCPTRRFLAMPRLWSFLAIRSMADEIDKFGFESREWSNECGIWFWIWGMEEGKNSMKKERCIESGYELQEATFQHLLTSWNMDE